MKYVPINTPVIVPGGLNDCEKFNRCSEVTGSPNCAIKGFAAVSRIDAPLPTVNSAIRNSAYFPLTAAGQNSTIPAPNNNSPVTIPALYPHFLISNAAGIAMQKYPKKFAVCTSCALNCESSNDFLNCWTRMSVRLFDMPHRKNSTVTITNGNKCPTGKTGCFFPASAFTLPPAVVETCIEPNLSIPTMDHPNRCDQTLSPFPVVILNAVLSRHPDPERSR